MNAPIPGVISFLACGSGPATLCRQLFGRTHSVRSMYRSTRAMYSVETHLAEELFGEQLLSVLSDRLRALLDLKNVPLETSAEPGSAGFPAGGRGVTTQGAANTALQRHIPTEVHRIASVSRPGDEDAHGESGEKSTAAHFGQSVSAAKDNLIEFEPHSRATAQTDWPPGSAGSTARTEAAAVPLIVRLIRDYWKNGQHKPNQLDANEILSVNSPPAIDRNLKSDTGPARRLPPDQISDRMRAFVSGPFSGSSLHRNATAAESCPPTSNEPKSKEPVFSAQPRWASSRSALAEKLADILREQAIQHGVDIS